MNIVELLQELVDRKGSDLHLKVGSEPWIRVENQMIRLSKSPLSREAMNNLLQNLVEENLLNRFFRTNELDLGLGFPGLGRFRVNLYRQKGEIGIALRHISETIPELSQLNLPPAVKALAEENRGLVLVTGTTGSGKSTTLAAMIGHINRTRKGHIVTIEDPIEFVHEDDQCLINQREIM